LRPGCQIRPNALGTHIRSARLDDLDMVDAAFVVRLLSRERVRQVVPVASPV